MLAAVLLAAGLLAACAAPSQHPSQGAGGDHGAAAPPSSTANSTPTTTPPGPPTTGGSGQPAKPATVTVTGTIKNGVEPGCILLDAGPGHRYVLQGDAGKRALLVAGARVRITGRPAPELLSYCQQGPLLVVLGAQPAG
jgi:hypothetical protein